jgi:hypothetical protein
MDAAHLQSEMATLFATFLPTEVAERFSYLLSLKPSRWGKIDPWEVWKHLRPGSPSVTESTESCAALLESSAFRAHAAAPATVLRCGHDRPFLGKLGLREALTGEDAVFEGFISVVPGKLGLAVNHDGGLCILRK